MHFISQIIYDLKRSYPAVITFIRKSSTTVDLDTGKVVEANTEYSIPRAVVPPKQFSFKKQAGLGLNSELSVYDRLVLIDAKDLPPSFEIKSSDQIRYLNKVWDISEIENYEGLAYALTIKEVA